MKTQAKKLFCRVRKDLLKDELGVPIFLGQSDKEHHLFTGKKIQYRWLEDTEGFQVKHNGRWYNAYSIDFDFED